MKKMKKMMTLILSLCILAASAAFAQAEVAQDAAEAAALADAGIAREDALLLQTEISTEHSQTVYDIEFECGDLEYEYWISAGAGSIVKRAWEPTAARALELYMSQSRDSAAIAETAARQSALSAAGVAEADVIFDSAWIDSEDGVRVYEVSFFTADAEYEYQIDAVSGAVYSASVELFPAEESARPGEHLPTDGQSSTGRENAKATALADAGLSASNVTFTKVKLDWEDGIQVYEIEFVTADTEYEYEINAATGEIHSRSSETFRRKDTATSGNAGSYIGVDQAKSIAVKHAGLSASDVTFTKAKLENDDGQKQYEIEFRRNGVEYEYSIHATTGSILDYETDRDDDDVERCDYCGKTGHDDDHCPNRPAAKHDDDDDDVERCDYCGKTGHDDDHCPNRPAAKHDDDDDDDVERCDYCGKTGHDDDRCPNRPAKQHHDDDDDDHDDDDDDDDDDD